MKRRFLLATILAAMALGASGCASKASYSGDIKDEIPVEDATSASGSAADVSVEPGFSETPQEVSGPSGGLLDRRLIGFEYDKSVVAEEFLPTISAHAEYLVHNPSARIALEGNADERGSNEYNLALGQRRANAVRDIMLASGVRARQIETLSFGEEDPLNPGHNEAAWAENRRVKIRYSSQ